ncbi:hypothetical protein ACOSQ3_023670 [Xanthoceras sorbifolium]
MGRVKIPLKKVENKICRHNSFSKRKNGLVKKAYELSTLCDVDVGLIIFSPAGKLFLFDGKRRCSIYFLLICTLIRSCHCYYHFSFSLLFSFILLYRTEEILKSYIGLPHHQRGRDMDSRMVDIQEIQDEISLRNVELEDVEKQLENFVKSLKCIKSITELEYHERMLEDTMKDISLHKEVLEKKGFSQLQAPSHSLHPQTASANNFMTGSSNYGLGWPQQHDSTQFLTINFTNSTAFQPIRNESDPFAETFPTSMAFIGANYSVGNAAPGDSDLLQSSMAFNNTGYPGSGNTKAVTGGSDKHAPSMAFSGIKYLAGNKVNDGSDQFDYGFFSEPPIPEPEPRLGSCGLGSGIVAMTIEDVVEGNGGSSTSPHDFSEIPFPFYPASTKPV